MANGDAQSVGGIHEFRDLFEIQQVLQHRGDLFLGGISVPGDGLLDPARCVFFERDVVFQSGSDRNALCTAELHHGLYVFTEEWRFDGHFIRPELADQSVKPVEDALQLVGMPDDLGKLDDPEGKQGEFFTLYMDYSISHHRGSGVNSKNYFIFNHYFKPSVIKAKKNIEVFTFLLKILLFFALIWLFFNQVRRVDWSQWNDFSLQHPLLLGVVILLVFVNWGLEFTKWNVVLNFSGVGARWKVRFRSFLAGIITGLLTPNMIGNFIGRMFYFQRRDRIAIVLLTLYANAAQFLASIFFGLIAVCWLGIPDRGFSWPENHFLAVVIVALALLTLLYFTFERIPFRPVAANKYIRRIRPLMIRRSFFRVKLLLLSFARHFVFTLQYWLLLKAFGLEINLGWFGWIWQVFFWATLIPSLWFGKLVIRESMALWILAPLTSNPALILFASVFLWVLNQAVPAAVGIPYLRTQKSPHP